MAACRASERRARSAMASPRASRRCEATRGAWDVPRVRLRDLAGVRVRYGYRRLHVLLRREGREVDHNRVYRLYSQERLTMCRKVPRRHVACQPRVERPADEAADRTWAIDFMSDTLSGGREIRPLTILDLSTRECPAIHVGSRPTGEDVVKVPEGLARTRGGPRSLKTDDGPGFTGRSLDLWAYFDGVTPDFSEPGKPTDNAFIESFDGRVREDRLDRHRFICPDDARSKTGRWRDDYHEKRPRSALGDPAPGEFARIETGVDGSNSGSKLA